MTTLPLLSGQEAVKVFVNLGWEVARQRGSHIILSRRVTLLPFQSPITGKLLGGRSGP